MTKTPEEIALMREAGKRLARVMYHVTEMAVEGTNLLDLDKKAGEMIAEGGDEILFKGYAGFPANICLSLNEVVVHGFAYDYELQNGDVISIDMGLRHDGWCADMARTVIVGEVSSEVRQLVDDTKQSFYEALKVIKDGVRTGDIGHAVQKYCEDKGYGVVRDLTGHGIGKNLHQDPSIPNFGEPGTGSVLHAGDTIAIEPMVALGTWQVDFDEEDWPVAMKDGKMSAHHENTLLVTEDGVEILTQNDDFPV